MDFMNEKLILKEIESKNFHPLYFLHGEEPYFIDLISNSLKNHALEEHEKEFNQSILYGKTTDPLVLLNELKSFPMGSEKRLVILKEAQDFKKIEIPTGIAIFPKEMSEWPPRSYVERIFNVKQWTEMKSGGHFASLEKPDLLIKDVSDFFQQIKI